MRFPNLFQFITGWRAWKLALLLGVISLFGPAWAQPYPTLVISTGNPALSYHKVMVQAVNECGKANPNLQFKVLTSTGTDQNVERLLQNEVSLAPVQVDGLALAGGGVVFPTIRLLTPFLTEQVHILALKEIRQASWSKLPAWAQSTTLGTVKVTEIKTSDDLIGRPVAATGGGKITLAVMTQKGFNVQQVNAATLEEALGKLDSGEVAGVLITGAAPISSLKSLPPATAAKYRLVSLSPALIDGLTSVGAFYGKSPAMNNYSNFGWTNVQTVSVYSAIAVRNYSDRQGDYARAAATFRQCLYDVAPSMGAVPGAHPAWEQINPAKMPGVWPAWEGPKTIGKK